MKRLAHCTPLALCILFAAASDPSSAQSVFTDPPRVLFRHYALSACLGEAFPDLRAEADAAAGGFVQYGAGPAEAYAKADALASKFLRKDYPSQSGATMDIMKCIDFSSSPEIEDLVARYIPAKPRKR